jgi:hypothetical protein
MLPKNKAQFIGWLRPEAEDAINPHGPLAINDHLVELFVADAVKSVAAGIADKNLKKRGVALSSKIAAKATQGMLASWDDGGDICPPWPWPRKWPFPWPPKNWMSDMTPIPDPWTSLNLNSVEQTELVATLVALSSLTMEKEFNTEMKGLATSMAQGISSQLADEVEKCGTVPRKPWGSGPGPRPKGVVGGLVSEPIGG